jgi:hypothetical protein
LGDAVDRQGQSMASLPGLEILESGHLER